MFKNESEVYDFLLELNIMDFCRLKCVYENGILLRCINFISDNVGLKVVEVK
jgi:hypothetical protein